MMSVEDVLCFGRQDLSLLTVELVPVHVVVVVGRPLVVRNSVGGLPWAVRFI